uniref:WD_REPEATS_REGION domain-containing protein n=1 Tax=Macrostomum lignano TaxID=282301 RepID=A0A1I8I4Y1_9PLAT
APCLVHVPIARHVPVCARGALSARSSGVAAAEWGGGGFESDKNVPSLWIACPKSRQIKKRSTEAAQARTAIDIRVQFDKFEAGCVYQCSSSSFEFELVKIFLTIFVSPLQDSLDVRQHTTLGNGDTAEQFVQLFVVADGKLRKTASRKTASRQLPAEKTASRKTASRQLPAGQDVLLTMQGLFRRGQAQTQRYVDSLDCLLCDANALDTAGGPCTVSFSFRYRLSMSAGCSGRRCFSKRQRRSASSVSTLASWLSDLRNSWRFSPASRTCPAAAACRSRCQARQRQVGADPLSICCRLAAVRLVQAEPGPAGAAHAEQVLQSGASGRCQAGQPALRLGQAFPQLRALLAEAQRLGGQLGRFLPGRSCPAVRGGQFGIAVGQAALKALQLGRLGLAKAFKQAALLLGAASLFGSPADSVGGVAAGALERVALRLAASSACCLLACPPAVRSAHRACSSPRSRCRERASVCNDLSCSSRLEHRHSADVRRSSRRALTSRRVELLAQLVLVLPELVSLRLALGELRLLLHCGGQQILKLLAHYLRLRLYFGIFTWCAASCLRVASSSPLSLCARLLLSLLLSDSRSESRLAASVSSWNSRARDSARFRSSASSDLEIAFVESIHLAMELRLEQLNCAARLSFSSCRPLLLRLGLNSVLAQLPLGCLDASLRLPMLAAPPEPAGLPRRAPHRLRGAAGRSDRRTGSAGWRSASADRRAVARLVRDSFAPLQSLPAAPSGTGGPAARRPPRRSGTSQWTGCAPLLLAQRNSALYSSSSFDRQFLAPSASRTRFRAASSSSSADDFAASNSSTLERNRTSSGERPGGGGGGIGGPPGVVGSGGGVADPWRRWVVQRGAQRLRQAQAGAATMAAERRRGGFFTAAATAASKTMPFLAKLLAGLRQALLHLPGGGARARRSFSGAHPVELLAKQAGLIWRRFQAELLAQSALLGAEVAQPLVHLMKLLGAASAARPGAVQKPNRGGAAHVAARIHGRRGRRRCRDVRAGRVGRLLAETTGQSDLAACRSVVFLYNAMSLSIDLKFLLVSTSAVLSVDSCPPTDCGGGPGMLRNPAVLNIRERLEESHSNGGAFAHSWHLEQLALIADGTNRIHHAGGAAAEHLQQAARLNGSPHWRASSSTLDRVMPGRMRSSVSAGVTSCGRPELGQRQNRNTFIVPTSVIRCSGPNSHRTCWQPCSAASNWIRHRGLLSRANGNSRLRRYHSRPDVQCAFLRARHPSQVGAHQLTQTVEQFARIKAGQGGPFRTSPQSLHGVVQRLCSWVQRQAADWFDARPRPASWSCVTRDQHVIQRTSVATWSPGNQQPLLLAAGTSAHQLDATFSTSSVLELFKVDLTSPDTELKPSASIETADRFCRLMWGSHGVDADLPWGVLVGGTARGKLVVYNPERLATESSESAEVFTQSGHTGSVGALDLNPFQKNLLCTGGGESEIFVWDLANPSAQMAPGSKSLPADDVLGVAWNRQVSHILGSVFATRCIVWDLKKSEPIIKLTDSMCQMRLKHVVWHPKVATQLCLASDDDQTPLVQMWDLRYATSPMQQLNAHTKGILSMAWSPFDPDYLLSTSRDSSLICWDPNCSSPGGEIVVKATLPNRWIYDSAWSPKHPLLLCASSMDGQLSVLNILGGSDGEDSSAPAAAADNAANSASGSADPFAQVHQPSVPAQVWYHPGKAPKWMRPRCGARFGFGGRLVSFGCDAASDASGQQQQNRQAKISQVVTEPELVRRAGDLERALSAGARPILADIAAKDEAEQRLWQFLETNFSSDPRTQFLKLLGFEADEEGEAVSEKGEDKSEAEGGEAETDEFSAIAEEAKPLGLASATEDGAEDADLTKALIAGRIEIAVNLCLDKGRLAEAAILAVAGGAELYERTQARLFRLLNTDTGRLIRAVVTHACPYVVQHSGNEDWRHSLAFALTYASAEEFAELAEQVGRRLETDGRRQEAALCYICAGSVPRLAACLMPAGGEPRPLLLQDVVEKAEVLRLAVTDADHPSSAGDLGALTAHLGSYAEQLANQGELRAALRYLQPAAVAGDSNQTARAHRLYQALGCPPDVPAPPNPYRPTVAAASAVVNGGYRPVAGQQQQPRQQLPGKPQQQQQQQQQQPAAMYNPAANLYQPTSYAANRTNPPYPAYAAPPVQPVQSAYQPVGNTMYQPAASARYFYVPAAAAAYRNWLPTA